MPGPDNRLNPIEAAEEAPPFPLTTRRGFLLLSLGVLTGCATEQTLTALPSPVWHSAYRPSYQPPPAVATSPNRPLPEPAGQANEQVLSRAAWTRARPVFSRMERMKPIRYITVHHDAHEGYLTAQKDVAARLEAIRRYHKDVRGWGDIGYHFAIDRAGRIWESRPLAWQGAHVKDHNEGNIGVMALGNFDQQSPSAAQIEALDRQVSWLMRRYNVPLSRVRTHREWAPTICPGRTIQQHMDEARRNRKLG